MISTLTSFPVGVPPAAPSGRAPSAAAPTAAPTPALRELLVADGAAAAIGELLSNARLPAHLIAPAGSARAALAALSAALEGQRLAGHPLDVLHLVAHGRAGAISLGGHWIGTAALASISASLIVWNVRRIALWSCHVGTDSALAQVLAALTGAEVLASSAALGMVDGAPCWRLEGASGPASLSAPFAPAVMASWPHQLR